MNNIIRFWNQNRKGIIAGIIVIVLLIMFIQFLNSIAREKNKSTNKEKNISIEESELPTESIITGQKISVETTKSNVSIIEEFVDKCNNNDIDGAYNLLTDRCKELLFPTKQDFIDKYYNNIFSEKKSVGIENYKNDAKRYTYEVKYYNNALATGKLSENNYKDYITIINDSGITKLNISNYIKTKQINKSVEKNGIIVTVISTDIYQGYERYNIQIENKTEKAILINTNKKLETIYMLDDDNIMYSANTSEIANALWQIGPYMTRMYNIKFNKIYNPNIEGSNINFTDIVGDYEKYINTPDEVKDRISIRVNM